MVLYLAPMIMSIVKRLTNIQGEAEAFVPNVGIISPYLREFPKIMKESVFTLASANFIPILIN